jgi:hypothetical protein
VIKHCGKDVGFAKRIGNSYVLDASTERALLSGEVKDRNIRNNQLMGKDYVRWHKRFGHIGPQIISKVHTVSSDIGEAIRVPENQPTCE